MNLEAGDIAYFDFLHLSDSRKKEGEFGEWRDPKSREIWTCYEVNGKSRPMLVLSKNGTSWYILLYLTTREPEPSKKRYFYDRELRVIDSKRSFLQISERYKYPVNLAKTKIAKMDPITFSDVLRRLEHGYRPGINGGDISPLIGHPEVE